MVRPVLSLPCAPLSLPLSACLSLCPSPPPRPPLRPPQERKARREAEAEARFREESLLSAGETRTSIANSRVTDVVEAEQAAAQTARARAAERAELATQAEYVDEAAKGAGVAVVGKPAAADDAPRQEAAPPLPPGADCCYECSD